MRLPQMRNLTDMTTKIFCDTCEEEIKLDKQNCYCIDIRKVAKSDEWDNIMDKRLDHVCEYCYKMIIKSISHLNDKPMPA